MDSRENGSHPSYKSLILKDFLGSTQDPLFVKSQGANLRSKRCEGSYPFNPKKTTAKRRGLTLSKTYPSHPLLDVRKRRSEPHFFNSSINEIRSDAFCHCTDNLLIVVNLNKWVKYISHISARNMSY